MTAAKDFEGLHAFADLKKSPIGYEPFIHHLVKSGYAKEALTYVVKCDVLVRAEMYMVCGEWKLAAKDYKDRGDKQMLE